MSEEVAAPAVVAEEAAEDAVDDLEQADKTKIFEFVSELIKTADLATISIKLIRTRLDEELGVKSGRDYDKVRVYFGLPRRAGSSPD